MFLGFGFVLLRGILLRECFGLWFRVALEDFTAGCLGLECSDALSKFTDTRKVHCPVHILSVGLIFF